MRFVLFLAAVLGCSSGHGVEPEPERAAEPASGSEPGEPERVVEGERAGGHEHKHAGGHEHARGHDGYHKHDFSDPKQWARQFDDPKRAQWQRPDEVVALMEIAEGMTVADVGAGTGYFLGALSKAVGRGGKVLGLDTERSMVDYMAKRARRSGLTNVESRVVGGSDPGLGTSSVDRILIVNTWHHIDNRLVYARILKEALREGGRVFIVDYTLESPRGPPLGARLPPAHVIDELERGGLQARALKETLPYQYVIEGR